MGLHSCKRTASGAVAERARAVAISQPVRHAREGVHRLRGAPRPTCRAYGFGSP